MTPHETSAEAIGQACIACSGQRWRSLPVMPAPSMRSDGALVASELAKIECADCGLVRHASLQPAAADVFAGGYELYAHAPGGRFEQLRQGVYADWIVRQLDGWRASSVFDIGCGNGSLLLELARRLPGARLSGVDPSPEAVTHARAAGVDAAVGYLDASYVPAGRCDLVVSVNVIEHCPDPREFIGAVLRILAPGGRLLLVCPDGDRPSSELLVQDHFFTFTRSALRELLGSEGLTVLGQQSAPASLGEFQSVLAKAGDVREPRGAVERDDRLHHSRMQYLDAWKRLDDRLSDRCGQGDGLLCFGVGEAVRLLHAYAPRTAARITGYVADEPEGPRFAGRDIVRYDSLQPCRGQRMLLGVRTGVQPALARRLVDDGWNPIRWDDLVPADVPISDEQPLAVAANQKERP